MHPPNHLSRWPGQELSGSQGKRTSRSPEKVWASSTRTAQPGGGCTRTWPLISPARCYHDGARPVTAKPPTEGACYKEHSGPLPNLEWGTLEPLGIPSYAIFRLISCSTSAPLPQAPQADFPSNQIHVSPVPALELCEVSAGYARATKGCMPCPDWDSPAFPGSMRAGTMAPTYPLAPQGWAYSRHSRLVGHWTSRRAQRS